MPLDEDYLQQVRDRFADLGDVTSRKMFGGVGFWESGDMFAAMGSDSRLYLKTDDATRPRYEAAGAEAFAPPPSAGRRPMTMPYHSVRDEVWADQAMFREWSLEAIAVGHATAKRKRS